MTRVRFAPSPTGKLHIGHLRAAVPNAIFAKKTGGTFIVRMEDTDMERNVETAEKDILTDLAWLGLAADESPVAGGDFGPYKTSERHARGDYTKAVERLMADGRAYECFVSEDELDVMRKLQRSRNEPPRYDNRHRNLTQAEREKLRAEGKTPVIRFRMNDGAIEWNDMVRGKVKFEAENLGGDPVIVRSSGIPLFTLAGVVDDINQKITHVIRGEDHVANTAIQMQIFEALGAQAPEMAHIPLLLDAEGQKFSKRLGSLTVEALRESGHLPEAVVAYMMSLGTSYGAEPASLDEIAEQFEFSSMSRNAPRFDEEQLKHVNAAFIHQLGFNNAHPLLEKFVPISAAHTAEFWNMARQNMVLFPDAEVLANTCFGEIKTTVAEEDKEFITEALNTLPTGEYNSETWGTWVNALKEKTGRKGRGLFMPMRLALTGQQHGPELGEILPLMGEDLTRKRLNGALQG